MFFLAGLLDEYVYRFQKYMDGWGLLFAYIFTIVLSISVSLITLLVVYILSFSYDTVSLSDTFKYIFYSYLVLFGADFLMVFAIKLKN